MRGTSHEVNASRKIRRLPLRPPGPPPAGRIESGAAYPIRRVHTIRVPDVVSSDGRASGPLLQDVTSAALLEPLLARYLSGIQLATRAAQAAPSAST